MKVKLQASIANEDGVFIEPQIIDVRESIAHDWIAKQFAIDPEGEVIRMRDGTLKIERKTKATEATKATIETPESRMATVETADVKVSRRKPR